LGGRIVAEIKSKVLDSLNDGRQRYEHDQDDAGQDAVNAPPI
jgi:hypothetical protein